MKIKICGLKRDVDIDYVNELKPDYIGFVFAPNTKRYISVEDAVELKSKLEDSISAVGVFVNSPIDDVLKALELGAIDMVQLHGSENQEYIENLRIKTSAPIIKAFKIREEEDILSAENSKADYVLLDSGQGTGKVFDWSLIKNIKRDYFLAGGLSPNNVKDAIHSLAPYGVDVSSGVETDGKKDYKKIKEFIYLCREGKDSNGK